MRRDLLESLMSKVFEPQFSPELEKAILKIQDQVEKDSGKRPARAAVIDGMLASLKKKS